MEYVKSIYEVQVNIHTLDSCLDRKDEPEYSQFLVLIQRGRCFLPVKSRVGYRFYPSKFIGYTDNSIKKYLDNYKEWDGRYTNRELNKILKDKPTKQPEFELEYINYCKRLGITKIYNSQRKYWNTL